MLLCSPWDEWAAASVCASHVDLASGKSCCHRPRVRLVLALARWIPAAVAIAPVCARAKNCRSSSKRRLDVATASLARCLDRTHSKAIVERDDLMHRRFGHPAMFGDLFRFPRINQGVIDNEPALSAPSTWIVLQSAFHFLIRAWLLSLLHWSSSRSKGQPGCTCADRRASKR